MPAALSFSWDSISKMSEGETLKLDEIAESVAEVKGQVRDIWHILNGRDGSLGMSQKVAVLWRAHVLVVFAIGALGGSVCTALVLKTLGLLR